MQGGIFGGIECSLQMDGLGNSCLNQESSLQVVEANQLNQLTKIPKPTYTYKESLELPPLGFVDDVAGLSECGNDSFY